METILCCASKTNARQTHRSNVQASTAKQYYHISQYNEFLFHIVAELNDCFIDTPPECVGLLHLLPLECYSSELEDLPIILSKLQSFIKKMSITLSCFLLLLSTGCGYPNGNSTLPRKMLLRSWWMQSLPVTGSLSPTFVCCYIWH